MMTLNVLALFVAVFSLWNAADANTGESLEMRIYDHEFQVSDTQMRRMLEKAALEDHGFKLEITTKMMTEAGTGSDEPVYQKTHYYYKIVDCSKVPEVSEQVESLIPGIFGSQILTKIRGEMKTRNLDNLKKCQTGLEVHFKGAEGCGGANNGRDVRRDVSKRYCWWCRGCSATKVLVGN